MSIKQALNDILENNLDSMRQNFSSALTSKAVERLEEKKIDIARSYFGQVREGYNPAKEGIEAAKKDDDLRKRHMEKYGKLPKRLTGELSDKFAERKSKKD